MQRNTLYEESAISNIEEKERKFYNFFHILSIICFVIAAILAFFSVMVIQSYLYGEYETAQKVVGIASQVFFILLMIGAALIFLFIKKKFNRSYDYSFVEDELRITQVFNGKSRKFLTTVRADQILKIGWYGKPSYENTVRGLKKKPVWLTPNKSPADGKEFIYVFTSGTLGNTLYILECRRELLECLVRAAGVTKLERE